MVLIKTLLFWWNGTPCTYLRVYATDTPCSYLRVYATDAIQIAFIQTKPNQLK